MEEVTTFDRADWYIDTAFEIYCDANSKKIDELTEEEEEIVWERASLQILYFFTWLIENDMIDEEFSDEDALNDVKCRRINAYKYMSDFCSLKFVSEEVKESARDFVKSCYETYVYDYCDYTEFVLEKPLYSSQFSWDDYELIKKNIIDVAYNNYLNSSQQKSKGFFYNIFRRFFH